MIQPTEINGLAFYERIHNLNKDLKEIGVSDKNRWIFNHGTPTSMIFLTNRINSQFKEIANIGSKMAAEAPSAKIIEIVNSKDGPKNETERRSYELYRYLQIDFFQFFSSLRSLLDELCKYILCPYLEVNNRRLKESFDDLYSGNENSRRKIHEKHKKYFDSIQKNYETFGQKTRTPRDTVIHFSGQIEFKCDPTTGWNYALVAEGDIIQIPKGRNWHPIEELNEIMSLTADIFEKSISYIKN